MYRLKLLRKARFAKKINLAKRPARVNVRGALLSDTGVSI